MCMSCCQRKHLGILSFELTHGGSAMITWNLLLAHARLRFLVKLTAPARSNRKSVDRN